MIDYCPECGSDQWWDSKHPCPACGFPHRNEEAFVVESDEEFPNTEGENDHRTKKFTYPEEEKQYEEQE